MSGFTPIATTLSWTPNLQFGGANVGITYGTQSGTYAVSQKVAVVTFRITLTNKGSSTGAATISNLPVAVAAGAVAVGHSGYYSDLGTITPPFTGYASGTTLFFYYGGAVTAQTPTEANFTNTSDLMFTISYPTV